MYTSISPDCRIQRPSSSRRVKVCFVSIVAAGAIIFASLISKGSAGANLLIHNKYNYYLNNGQDQLSASCAAYLKAQSFANADELREATNKFACLTSEDALEFAPNPIHPHIPSADTTWLQCKRGNPSMNDAAMSDPLCCGVRPHFNWVLATCEKNEDAVGQFCAGDSERTPEGVPACLEQGAPRVNYIAAYQYDSHAKKWVLQQDSSVYSTETVEEIYGSFPETETSLQKKTYLTGDWTTKFAPATNVTEWTKGLDGPRGLTPPGALFVLSVESMAYGAFYMLLQDTLNRDFTNRTRGRNCWVWEMDAVEGALGWTPRDSGPQHPQWGKYNRLFSTSNAQGSGCMPSPGTYAQNNGGWDHSLPTHPNIFNNFCDKQPEVCKSMKEQPGALAGGAGSSQWMEYSPDVRYLIAVVFDRNGYWIYRWIPDGKGKTGWPGLEAHRASKVLTPAPRAVSAHCGLATEVPGNCPEAVILQPGLPGEHACARSILEPVDWQWGSSAAGQVAFELGRSGEKPASPWFGTQNWWNAFADTGQNASHYSPAIMFSGVQNAQDDSSECATWQGLASGACQDCPSGSRNHG